MTKNNLQEPQRNQKVYQFNNAQYCKSIMLVKFQWGKEWNFSIDGAAQRLIHNACCISYTIELRNHTIFITINASISAKLCPSKHPYPHHHRALNSATGRGHLLDAKI